VYYDIYGLPTFKDAAGNVIPKSSISNNILFQGREYDPELNLYYFRARYYDPIMGRFLQTDTMGYQDSMNLYQGFNMNPVNFTDPFGLLTQEQRMLVSVQVLRMLMGESGAFEILKNYRAEFGALTEEDIDYIFGKNDDLLGEIDLNQSTLIYFAGVAIALGIDRSYLRYDPTFSNIYGNMAGYEIDRQLGLKWLYDASMRSLKVQGVELTEKNYSDLLKEEFIKQEKSTMFAYAITSFVGHWSMRTGLKRNIPEIHPGKQGKHIPGHKNYIPGRSKLTADPNKLASKAGTGQPVNEVPQGMPGYKERIDFGFVIGEYIDSRGVSTPTTIGIITYSKDGTIHIIPARPK
jgi:RHS repeat-associated protein